MVVLKSFQKSVNKDVKIYGLKAYPKQLQGPVKAMKF